MDTIGKSFLHVMKLRYNEMEHTQGCISEWLQKLLAQVDGTRLHSP